MSEKEGYIQTKVSKNKTKIDLLKEENKKLKLSIKKMDVEIDKNRKAIEEIIKTQESVELSTIAKKIDERTEEKINEAIKKIMKRVAKKIDKKEEIFMKRFMDVSDEVVYHSQSSIFEIMSNIFLEIQEIFRINGISGKLNSQFCASKNEGKPFLYCLDFEKKKCITKFGDGVEAYLKKEIKRGRIEPSEMDKRKKKISKLR